MQIGFHLLHTITATAGKQCLDGEAMQMYSCATPGRQADPKSSREEPQPGTHSLESYAVKCKLWLRVGCSYKTFLTKRKPCTMAPALEAHLLSCRY